MINKDGHYILTITDWNNVIKYFKISPNTVGIREKLDMNFIEYQVYDIYTNNTRFSFYNHDGKIRFPSRNGKEVKQEIDISEILINKIRNEKKPYIGKKTSQ